MSDLAFIEYLKELEGSFPNASWTEVLERGPAAIIVVDLVRGFCDQGPLSGPRVNALVSPTADFLTSAHAKGVREVFLACDSHAADSPEFRQFPPHCIKGTTEADLAPGLASLPFAESFQNILKESLSAWLGTDLAARVSPEVRTLIVVGDCTDLCVHQTALTAQLMVNQGRLPWQVIVVSSLVDTYDLPLEVAREVGAVPHPGDFLHRTFLYHMHLNGVRVVRSIA